MAGTFEAEDWRDYRMVYAEPHRVLEPAEDEVAVVDAALEALRAAGMLPHTDYDREKFLAHRRAVAERFEIPWTAISPRMQRFIYALNAIKQPEVKERLRAETSAALERGVFGSPFFYVDDEPFWGNDRLDQVDRWLESGGW